MKIETFEKVLEETREYKNSNPGTENGPDYPAIAAALYQSEKFKSLCQAQAAMGMLSVLFAPKDIDPSDKAASTAAAEKLLNSSPIKDGLAQMFYIGYRIGKQAAEVERLEAMASTERA